MSMNRITAKRVFSVFLSDIECISDQEKILSSYSLYLIDESKMEGGKTDLLFFPKSEDEVASIISDLYEKRIPFTIQGGRTGIVGGAIPLTGALITFDLMNNILDLGFDEQRKKWFVKLQPGVTLDELNSFLKYKEVNKLMNYNENSNLLKSFLNLQNRIYYPVDPTESSAMIGGTVAANASGARSFKYGATRNWVKRLHVVLPNGYLLDIPRGKYFEENNEFIIICDDEKIHIPLPTYEMPKCKNAAGYYYKKGMDLIDLFIGSEGTLGVITEVELWLEEMPSILENILFFRNCINLLRLNEKKYPELNIKSIRDSAQAAISFGIQFQEDTLEQLFDALDELTLSCNSSLDDGWCAETENEQIMFHKLRHAVPEIVNSIIAKRKSEYPQLHKLGTDMAVSDQYIKEIMNYYHSLLNEKDLEYAIWGHIGDNHVHVNILPRNMEELKIGKELYLQFAKRVIDLGGTVSAEHGIGKIKKSYLKLMFGDEGIKDMIRVKEAIDNHWLLNRGNMFDK
ncbi:MAG: FAD-binding oxidoreductase [Candidatus Heimdallarchaeaceae archaeon]